MSSVGQALAKNSALQIGGKLLGTVFGLITFYCLLHFFNTEGVGYFTSAITYVTIFATIVDFGLTLTTAQMISKEGADEGKILGNLLSLRIVTAFVFFLSAPLIALVIPQAREIVTLITIGSVTYFLSSIAQMFIGVFQKRLAIVTAVLAETLNRFLCLVGVVIVGFAGLDLPWAAAAFTVGGLMQLIVMLASTNRKVRLRPRWEPRMWREIIATSWPIGTSMLFNLLYLKGDIIFMMLYRIPAEEIGQYGSAYKVVDVMTMIPVTFMGLLLPLLTTAWSQKNHEAFTRYFQNGFDMLSIIAVPLALGAILVGVPMMTAVDPELVLAGEVLAVLGPAAAVVFWGSLYGHAIVAINKQRVMTWGYLFVAVIAIAGYMIYIPIFGAWAAAWVTLVSEALIGFLTFVVVTYSAKLMISPTMFLRAFVASLAMAASLILIPLPHVFLSIALGMIVYGTALTLIGGPKPKDVAKLFLPDRTPLNP